MRTISVARTLEGGVVRSYLGKGSWNLLAGPRIGFDVQTVLGICDQSHLWLHVRQPDT